MSPERLKERLTGWTPGGDPGQVVASDAVQDERLLRREIRKQRRLGHLGGLGDLVDSHRVEAAFGEQPQRDGGDPLPRLLLLTLAKTRHTATIPILGSKSNPV